MQGKSIGVEGQHPRSMRNELTSNKASVGGNGQPTQPMNFNINFNTTNINVANKQ
jgi:hypothetical protein